MILKMYKTILIMVKDILIAHCFKGDSSLRMRTLNFICYIIREYINTLKYFLGYKFCDK